ncbi:MAG: organomercurial lyase [Cycloclasticus sp.]
MTEKLSNALNRLRQILPLKERQDTCSADIKQLHQQILWSFVDKGRAPSRDEMTRHVSDVSGALTLLNKKDMVTLSTKGELTGAYPFSVVERDHIVQVNGHDMYVMCALDALAVAPMFQLPTAVRSNCALTDEPVMINMLGEDILNLEETSDVHVGITWSATDTAFCCADSLCREMVFLKGEATAERWLVEKVESREIFRLPEATQFASRFFRPLLS